MKPSVKLAILFAILLACIGYIIVWTYKRIQHSPCCSAKGREGFDRPEGFDRREGFDRPEGFDPWSSFLYLGLGGSYLGGTGWSEGLGDWFGRDPQRVPRGELKWLTATLGQSGTNLTTDSDANSDLNVSADVELQTTFNNIMGQGRGNTLGGDFVKVDAEFGAKLVDPEFKWSKRLTLPGSNTTTPSADDVGGPMSDIYFIPGAYMFNSANQYATSDQLLGTGQVLRPVMLVDAPTKPLTGEGRGYAFLDISGTRLSICDPLSGSTILEKEQYCQGLSAKEAGTSQSCCVALNGVYPMAGNESGPFNRDVYADASYKTSDDPYFYTHLGQKYVMTVSEMIDHKTG